jgi:hypothetical protein
MIEAHLYGRLNVDQISVNNSTARVILSVLTRIDRVSEILPIVRALVWVLTD